MEEWDAAQTCESSSGFTQPFPLYNMEKNYI